MHPPRRSVSTLTSRGFTLLELMIVVVVIGILTTLFILSISSVDNDESLEHAERLDVLLNLALEEASINGREYGLRFYQHGYEFSVRNSFKDENNATIWAWTPLDADQLLKPRDVGEDISLDLEIDGKDVVLEFERKEDMADRTQDEDEDEAIKPDAYKPQIFLLSSGDVEPEFVVRIRPSFEMEGILLEVDADGSTELIRNEFER